MRGSKEIQSFPDPIPVEVEDGLQHSEGLDENEKFLPSKLQDVSKQPNQGALHTDRADRKMLAW